MAENINNEKSLLIWFDDVAIDSEDNKFAQEQLRAVNSNFRMIKSRAEFDEYVKSGSPDARISLIVSGRLGEQILPEIQSIVQIPNVYVYCIDKAKHEKWSKPYDKVSIW